MSNTQTNIDGSTEQKPCNTSKKRPACVIAMPSLLHSVGNSYSLRLAVNHRWFKTWLKENNKKALLLSLAPHKDYASEDFLDMTARKKGFHSHAALFYFSHLQMWSDGAWKLFQRPDRNYVCHLGNFDLVALRSSFDHNENKRAIHNVAKFLALEDVKRHYDLILIDLPPFIQYYREVESILKHTNYILLTYPLKHPDALQSIFTINDTYYQLLYERVPIQLGGIIALGVGVDLNSCRNQLECLNENFGEDIVLSVIPDANQSLSSIKKEVRNVTKIGPKPITEKLVQLICSSRPRGLYKAGRENARRFEELWNPRMGTLWKNFTKAPLKPREPQATLEQIAMELTGKNNWKFADYLISSLYFGKYQTFDDLDAKMKAALEKDGHLEQFFDYAGNDNDEIIINPVLVQKWVEIEMQREQYKP